MILILVQLDQEYGKRNKVKKYENYTEQEIVNMVVEAYRTNIKYMYKGMSLRKYCLKDDSNVQVLKKIRK